MLYYGVGITQFFRPCACYAPEIISYLNIDIMD